MACTNNYYIDKLHEKTSQMRPTRYISSGTKFEAPVKIENYLSTIIGINIVGNSTIINELQVQTSTLSKELIYQTSTLSKELLTQTNTLSSDLQYQTTLLSNSLVTQTNTLSSDLQNQTGILSDEINKLTFMVSKIRPVQNVSQNLEVNVELDDLKEYLSTLLYNHNK